MSETDILALGKTGHSFQGRISSSATCREICLWILFPKPMKQTRGTPMVKDIMTKNVSTIHKNASVYEVAKKIMEVFQPFACSYRKQYSGRYSDGMGYLKAAAHRTTFDLVENIMTKKVITAIDSEQVTIAARRLEQHGDRQCLWWMSKIMS